MVGSGRISSNSGDTSRNRGSVKMHQIYSDSPSQGTELTTPSLKLSDENVSQIVDVAVNLDVFTSHLKDTRKAVIPVKVTLDLNRDATTDEFEANATSSWAEKRSQVSFAPGIPIELNAEDVASSVNHGSTRLSHSGNHTKSKDVSECGSTIGPTTAKVKDPLRRWEEMKQNGFLSSPHMGLLQRAAVASSSRAKIPLPKRRPKKSKNEVLPKMMESAKREYDDRFPMLAAPSGLLNGLNLGIINHVRNKKQVHSIIEAIVRSEALENGHTQSKQANQAKHVHKETMAAADTGKHHLGPSHGSGRFSLSVGNKNVMLPLPIGQSGSSMLDKIGDRASVSYSPATKEVELRRTEVLPSAKACEESSTFSNEASTNSSSVSLLSTRAANVAVQWLELLYQDIKARLSALRRSKKRVRSVLTTELPFLISKEFSTDKENVFCYNNGSSDGLANNRLASMHLARWSKLFDQMDKALSAEEKQLDSWLCDVRKMQLHFDNGSHQGTLESSNRNVQADRLTRELNVRAAAASIYSTCNFLMPEENAPCF